MTAADWVRALCLVVALSSGCARPAGELFPAVWPAITFPPSPNEARLRYVGQLRTNRDLSPAVSGWQAFSNALTGAPADRSVSAPAGLAVSARDRLFVTDPPMHCLHVFDLQARTYRCITTAGQTPLDAPADVAIVGDRAYVTDAGRGVIDVFSDAGEYVTTWQSAAFKRPVGIAASPNVPRLYVVDAGNHAVVGLSLDGVEQLRFGKRGADAGSFNFPTFVAVDAELGVIVADSMNFRVQRFTLDGQAETAFGKKGDAAGDFALPKGVAVDAEHYIYVADAHFENVQVFDGAGKLMMAFGQEGQKPGEFWLPAKLFIDHKQRLWVADSYNRRVQVFQLLGRPTEGSAR